LCRDCRLLPDGSPLCGVVRLPGWVSVQDDGRMYRHAESLPQRDDPRVLRGFRLLLMSSTGRGADRIADDVYPTPAWTVARLLEGFPDLPGGLWLEPCVGAGSIVRAVRELRDDVRFHGIDVRNVEQEALAAGCERFWQGSFLDSALDGGRDHYEILRARPAVIVTNPPYTRALEVVQRAMEIGAEVVMLLRLNFLGSGDRSKWLRQHPPDIGVLPNRPSFAASVKCAGKESCGWRVMQALDAPRAKKCPNCDGYVSVSTTDSIEYGWFRWPAAGAYHAGRREVTRRESGKIFVLDDTPEAHRRVTPRES